MKEKKERGKDKKFIWKSLRIAFWIMIGTFLLSFWSESFPTYLSYPVNIVCYISIIFTFVVSIIHLTKYKEKILAIIALVSSSLIILLLFLSMIVLIAQYSVTV
ncbi:hypothetical protein M0R72_10005 [Candidatus Pacearchaeota archaeon]|nr:hypothetical protein [Candidatus Pacearchaeota archaeon]